MSNADGYLNILLEPIYAQKLCCSRKWGRVVRFLWVTRSHVNLNISICPPLQKSLEVEHANPLMAYDPCI